MAQRYYDYEAGSNGVALTGALLGPGASNPVVGAGGSAMFADNTPYRGSLHGRYSYPIGDATGTLQQVTPEGTHTSLSWTFAFRIGTDLAVATWANIASFRISGGPLYSVRIEWTNPGAVARLYLFAGSSNLGQIGNTTLSEDGATWYRVSGEVDGSSGSYTVRLRQGSDDSLIGTPLSGANAGMVGTITAARLGINGTVAAALVIDVDQIGFDDGVLTEMPPSITAASPIADAGAHQAVLPGATVQLDGTASTNTTSYTWSFLWPASGAPSLTDATTATPSFTAGPAGSVYTLQLVASNGAQTDTATVNVAVVPSLTEDTGDLVWTGSQWQ